MQQHRWIKWLLIAVVTVMMSACGGGSGTGGNTVPSANPFALTLDVNESTATANWLSESSASDAEGNSLTATVKTQGSYGTFVVTGDSISYLKTTETNTTDIGILEISDGTDSVRIPLSIKTLYWKQISAGNLHTVALKSDGTLWAWGYNGYGQLGDGTTAPRSVPTQESSAGTNWRSVSAGDSYTAALKSDGTLWAWGDNGHGRLGDGGITRRFVPTQVSSAGTNWRSVSAGSYHTIALKSDGTLWAWGDNSHGQLGDGTTTPRSVPTQESTHASDWSSVSAGGYHTAALKSDDTLWAWGSRQSGNSPTQVGTGTNWSSVSAGYFHTAALKSDHTLWAWGDNSHGRLGDGTTIDRSVPTQESSASINWSSVSAGNTHTAALKDDHTLWAWGNNRDGRLGDGTTTNRSVPTQVGTGMNWSSVSAEGHTTALKSDDTLWVWGANRYGQLTRAVWDPVRSQPRRP